MVDLLSALGQENLDKLMQGLARRRYHVLLGAGASMGGRSQDGRLLPSGVGFEEELRDAFRTPQSGFANLRRTYAAARNRKTGDGSDLPAYIRKRFTNTTPPEWLRTFVQVAWQQVWTLNIDDCLSRAYVINEDIVQQRLVSVSWTDRHRAARESGSELVAVHLHGKASRANRNDELIFDISSYIHATATQHRWHRLFGDAYQAQPFLIVGASLDAELDLQAVLDHGKLVNEHPSVIVLKDIDDLQEEEYRGYGLIPIRASAEAFFEAIVSLLPQYLADLTHIEAAEIAEVPPEAQQFLHQWKELSEKDAVVRDRRHDVFKGHEPLWADAVGGRLSARAVGDELAVLANSGATEPEKFLQIVSGPSFSGKTAAMFESVRLFLRKGYQVFQFDSQTSPNIKAIHWWIQRHPKTVLVFDDAADFAREIAKIYELAAEGPVKPRIMAVERFRRLNHIANVLSLTPRTDRHVPSTLTNREISNLLQVLKRNNRLGDLTGVSERVQFDYFAKEHNREIFTAMAHLERGREFQSRVIYEYDSMGSDEYLNLLKVAALAAHLGYGLPTEIVQASTGISPNGLNAALETELGDLLVITEGHVRLRHRYMGEVLIDHRLSVQEKYDLTIALGESVAPHVSVASIAASTVHYRIARALMGHDSLTELFDDNLETVLDWYEQMQPAFEWNARFWEQRALAAADADLFEPAYSWAREAVDRRSDALTLNTVGSVLIRRALYEARRGAWPSDTYEAAERSLREARSMRDGNEYPYETFMGYTLRLIKKVGSLDPAIRSFVTDLWNEWYMSIMARDEATRVGLHERLQAFQADWVKLMTVQPSSPATLPSPN